jgi:hypothetical protein
MSHCEQTGPVALHRLMRRLLEDHRRTTPHHAQLCPLCQDAEQTLDLLAEEVTDDFGDTDAEELASSAMFYIAPPQ